MKLQFSLYGSAFIKAIFAWVLLGLIAPSLRAQTPLNDSNFNTARDLWFSDQSSAIATYGHIKDWNVTGVTNMSNAFKDKTTFDENITGWDVSNVTNMSRMFEGASNFNQPIGDWNVSSVTNMSNLLYEAASFNQDIGEWNTSSVVRMDGMFGRASSFNQNIGGWDVSSVTNMSYMFYVAVSFDQDLSGWDVSNTTNMQQTFCNADVFNQDLSNWNVSNVTNMSWLFSNASHFNQDISSWNVSSVTTMRRMFFAADVFNQDLSNWNVSAVINMESMFYSADVFNQDLSNWNVSNVTNMDDMFASANTLSNVHKGLIHSAFSSNPNWTTDWSTLVPTPASLTNANFQTAVNLWCTDKTDAFTTYGHIKDWNVTGVTDMANAFMNRTGFNEDISGWDVSKVTNMSAMFYNAQSFNQPIGDWNVSAVANMSVMFNEAASFNQPIGDWNTSSVTTMDSMFRQASSFNQTLGNWNTSSVTRMQNMFSGAASFNGLIGTWNVSAVTDMTAMFSHASSFNQPIGGWDVSAVTRMGNLFDGAASFNQPIGGWNVSAVTAMNRIFASAVSFDQDLGDWNVSAVTNMSGTFDDTPSLSDANKGKIQSGFSASQDWTYDWSAYVATPPPNQTGDNNQTAPPVDFNSTLFRPLLQTLDREELGAGSIRLWGMILADGESPLTEVAFEVADNLVFRNSTLHPASMLEGSPNFSATLELQADKHYYYRAVATNAAGSTKSATKSLFTQAEQANWWSDSVETAGGWRHSPWLGAFRPYENGWIYHTTLGWAYAHPDGSGGLWLWFRDHRWTWTQEGVFPYLWKHDLGTWHYLIGTRNGQPLFYEWTGRGNSSTLQSLR